MTDYTYWKTPARGGTTFQPVKLYGNPSGISIRFLFNFNFFNMCAEFFQSTDQVFVSALNLVNVADSAFSVSAHRCYHHRHTGTDIRRNKMVAV